MISWKKRTDAHKQRRREITYTVLIMETDNILRTFYKEELEEEGYRVLLAENERKALEVITDNLPDFIITNYQLSPTNLFVTLLHEARDVRKIPMIVCTAYPLSSIDSNLCKEIKCIVKSSNLDILKHKMKKMLNNNNHNNTSIKH